MLNRLLWKFEGGRPDFPKLGPTGLSFRADIAVFASLYWGALSILEARRFGLIELEGEGDRALLNRLFHLPKPICYDQF